MATPFNYVNYTNFACVSYGQLLEIFQQFNYKRGGDQVSDQEELNDDRALLPFEEEGVWPVRREWHKGQWYFSIIDSVRVLTDSPTPRRYWAELKRKLQDEGASEVFAQSEQLKMRALDGKMRATDAANVETLLRIIQSIPSPKAEPYKRWLAKVGAERLEDVIASRDEPERRILIRGEVAEKNAILNSVAAAAGVLTRRDFAVFHDAGYTGMYNGERENDIHARKGLAPGESILDWMGSTELAANLFRITQTEDKLRREPVANKEAANKVHHNMGKAVRQFILDQGGTPPEQLPTPEKSIKELQRQEQKRIEAERQPSLFDTDASDPDAE